MWLSEMAGAHASVSVPGMFPYPAIPEDTRRTSFRQARIENALADTTSRFQCYHRDKKNLALGAHFIYYEL